MQNYPNYFEPTAAVLKRLLTEKKDNQQLKLVNYQPKKPKSNLLFFDLKALHSIDRNQLVQVKV